MKLTVCEATTNDVADIVNILNDTANELTKNYGRGQWSYLSSEKGVLYTMKGKSKVLVARSRGKIIGTLTLVTKKPWAIDASYFTEVQQPLYLIGMAVAVVQQRKGVGRFLLEQTKIFATDWPAQTIRLDAYDSVAGAGDFYRKCGYTERGRVKYKGNPLIYFELLL